MKTVTILTTAAFALAGTAHAGDMSKKSDTAMMDAQPVTVQTTTVQSAEIVSVRQLDGAVITSVPADQNYAVLGVVERDGQTMYRIAGTAGDEFVNHVPADLTDVTTDIDELDTYTYEYNGRTFTNRIVRDDADSVG